MREPLAFLMDEPLSNLDALLRVEMRTELLRLHKRVGRTTIHVTHDQIEAMTMADRIVLMNKGEIQQIGSPAEIYEAPANTFVAKFVGSPPMNLIEGRVDVTAGGPVFGGAVQGCARAGPARPRPAQRPLASARSISSWSKRATLMPFRPEWISSSGSARSPTS
ncbi:MAG: hypothetical protein R3D05_14565 [Dongiaceae bacterium]